MAMDPTIQAILRTEFHEVEIRSRILPPIRIRDPFGHIDAGTEQGGIVGFLRPQVVIRQVGGFEEVVTPGDAPGQNDWVVFAVLGGAALLGLVALAIRGLVK